MREREQYFVGSMWSKWGVYPWGVPLRIVVPQTQLLSKMRGEMSEEFETLLDGLT